MAEKKTGGVLSRLSGKLQIPATAVTAMPQIELFGNRQMVIDGCRGVLIYDSAYIRLAVAGGALTVTGDGLELTTLTPDCATVTGGIKSLIFGE